VGGGIVGRRLALLGAAGVALAGCGFRPLYGPVVAEGGVEEDIRAELAAVRISNMGDRFGQLLRRDLQRRFEGARPGVQARYLLTVGVAINTEVLGYRRDGTISRVRYIASGAWNLATQSVPPQILARSTILHRVIDSFNVPDLQFFAADTARDAMERRLVEALGEDVYREVLMALRRYRETGSAQAAAAVPGSGAGGRTG
jgi:LPS-assembly lipoprotein